MLEGRELDSYDSCQVPQEAVLCVVHIHLLPLWARSWDKIHGFEDIRNEEVRFEDQELAYIASNLSGLNGSPAVVAWTRLVSRSGC